MPWSEGSGSSIQAPPPIGRAHPLVPPTVPQVPIWALGPKGDLSQSCQQGAANEWLMGRPSQLLEMQIQVSEALFPTSEGTRGQNRGPSETTTPWKEVRAEIRVLIHSALPATTLASTADQVLQILPNDRVLWGDRFIDDLLMKGELRRQLTKEAS